MGNCLHFRKPMKEICYGQKATIKRPAAGKFSSHTHMLIDRQSNSCPPQNKRQMGPATGSDATNGGIKKIRLLVTKQELRELLVSKAMSVEELLGVLQREERFRVDFVPRWQPLLETIPEGSCEF